MDLIGRPAILNRTILSRFSLPNKTFLPINVFTNPYEVFFKRRTFGAGFRMFGCLAYARIPKEHQLSKVDPNGRGLKGIFVGIADFHHTTYIIWIPKLDSFIESRDVIFDEAKNYKDYKVGEGLPVTKEDYEFELEDENTETTNTPRPT